MSDSIPLPLFDTVKFTVYPLQAPLCNQKFFPLAHNTALLTVWQDKGKKK